MSPWMANTLVALGAARYLRWRRRHQLPVLMYHGVVPKPLTPFCWHQLDVDAFERQMAYVAKHYRARPLASSLDQLRGGSLAPRTLCITFDDGFRNNLTRALPVLERHDLCATVFLTTSFIDGDEVLWPDRLYLAVRASDAKTWDASALGLNDLPLTTPDARAISVAKVCAAMKRTPVAQWPDILRALLDALRTDGGDPDDDFRGLTWDDVRTLTASGRIDVAAHTVTHPILSQASDHVVRDEIEGSHRIVTERSGTPPRVFAYPNGRTQDFDERAQDVVRDLRIPYALTTELGLVRRDSPPLALPRVCVGADLSFGRFQLLAAGA